MYSSRILLRSYTDFTEHLSTASSDVYRQSFAAYKINQKRLINDLISDLEYLRVNY